MFTRFFKLSSFICAIAVLGFSGCMKDGPNNGPDDNTPTDVFEFSTKTTYTLNLEYSVPKGYQVYFEVYDENPLTADEAGNLGLKKGLVALDKGYTDANGRYSNPIMVPAAVKNLYVYTPDAGVPQVLTCNVANGELTNASLPAVNTEAGAKTRATAYTASCNEINYPNINTVLLGNWINSYKNVTIPNISFRGCCTYMGTT